MLLLLFLQKIIYTASEFIAFARNLTEDVVLEESKKWTAASVKDIPLESDEIVLEYLCRHNYDVEQAKFNLMCVISGGKGSISKYERKFVMSAFSSI